MPKPPVPKSLPKSSPSKPLPILLVDVPHRDRHHIIQVLKQYDLECTEPQAESLRVALNGIVPDDPLECFGVLWSLIQVDWDACRDRLTEVLSVLAAEYMATTKEERSTIERVMLIATSGLTDHPRGWDFPCACDECNRID